MNTGLETPQCFSPIQSVVLSICPIRELRAARNTSWTGFTPMGGTVRNRSGFFPKPHTIALVVRLLLTYNARSTI